MIEFRMPSLGADMDDGEFVEWRVAPGERVERGQVVCVVDTQKGAIDVEIWDAGTVARLIAEPGQRIPVGQPMALVAGEGEDWRVVAAAPVPPPSLPPAPVQPAPVQPAPVQPAFAPPSTRGAAQLRASPAARKRAAELGIDLAPLADAAGAAPISLADVERAAAAASPQAAMRAAIAAAMVRSKREIPHYYLGCEVDVEYAQARLEQFNATQPIAERILFAALAMREIALALREAPELNGRFVDGRFVHSEAIHLGVVISLRGGGIVVPTIHDADRLAPAAWMAALREVLSRARAGRLRSSDLADSTITVTNLGDLGVETVYGVIYPPQVAIIGLGRVATRPIVRDGAIAAARTMNVTLSGDHRVSDGLTGARFLAALRQRLERPSAP